MIIRSQYYRRFLEYAAPHWKMLALAFLGMALAALTLSVLPAFILHLFDSAVVNKNQELIQQMLLVIMVLLIVRSVMLFISNFAINTVGGDIATELRLTMFKKLLALSDNRHTTLSDHEITLRFISDLNQLIQAATNVITTLIKDSLTIIGLLAWMFYLNRDLALFVLLLTALLIVITQLTIGFLTHANLQAANKKKKVVIKLLKTKKNHKIITLHSGQSHESERFLYDVDQLQHAQMRQAATRNLGIILIQFFTLIIFSAIGYLAIQLLSNQEITPGEAGSIILAGLLLAFPIKQMLNIKNDFQRGQRALDKTLTFLDEETKTETGIITMTRAHGELMFDHVSYYHGSQKQPLLENFTLSIQPGDVIAFIDVSGSCKIALIDLILRFRQPNSGKIRLDGYDLENLKSTSLYANIALLSGNVPLIDDTAAANIAYGEMRCANEASITAAAQASRAMDFIREMPHGLQTQLGGYGIKLSGKQRQHIGIARALLKNAPILILDEITALPDTESGSLQDALKTLVQGRTTLIFTPHTSAILENANRIVTFKNGNMTDVENRGSIHAEKL